MSGKTTEALSEARLANLERQCDHALREYEANQAREGAETGKALIEFYRAQTRRAAVAGVAGRDDE